MDIIAVHGIVSGEVQGVGFRFFVSKTAAALGINGWVRNCPNGDVEFEAEASADAIAAFLSAVRRGSAWSHITEVKTRPIDPKGYNDFSIED